MEVLSIVYGTSNPTLVLVIDTHAEIVFNYAGT